MKKAKIYLISLTILCCVTSCVSIENKETACIPPLTNFAYFTGQATPYPDTSVAPPAPWVSEAVVELDYPVLLGVRVLPTKKENEFWIWDADLWSPDQNSHQQLFIFRTDEAGLKPVLLDDALVEFVFPLEKLFIAPDNSVWVVQQTSKYSEVPILGKYDDVTGRILPVVKLGEIQHHLDYQTIVLMDENTGVFWFLVPYGFIYSYDPASNTLVQHISIEDKHPTGAAMTPDGNIYIYLLRHGSPTEQQDALYLYSPRNESVEYITIGLEVDFYNKDLFVDHAGRLWLGSFGWREMDGKWYQTLRSPLFVLPSVEAGGERLYHWVPPSVRFETPNDFFWFTSSQGGTYSLDFRKGEWCWVSTSSYLQKDSDGNLWLMVGQQLFRLSETP